MTRRIAANALTGPIERGVPLIILAPHLDDAALSCGALMTYAVKFAAVTVATLFTEGGEKPYTLSARRYLHQVGARDAHLLYARRRAEDRAALEPIGINCVHAGFTEALFRRRSQSPRYSVLANLIPEIAHVYPVYRMNITRGRLASGDAGTLNAAIRLVKQLVGDTPSLVLAPLAVGGHVDHLLVRTAAEQSVDSLIYYSDFPYNQRDSMYTNFISEHDLVEARWIELAEAKADMVRVYGSQVMSLFQDGRIPLVPEVFFLPNLGTVTASRVKGPRKAEQVDNG